MNKWGCARRRSLGRGQRQHDFRDLRTLAKLDYVPDLSSHSLRRGMATSTYRAGADFRDIKKRGGMAPR
jgi:site-specific recombinase XerD